MIVSIDISYNPVNCGWAVFTDKLKSCGKFSKSLPSTDQLAHLHREALLLLADVYKDFSPQPQDIHLALDWPLMFPYKDREDRAGPRANLNSLAKNHQAIGALRAAFKIPPERVLLYISSDHEDDKATVKTAMLAKYPVLPPKTPHHITDAIKIGEWALFQLKLPLDIRSTLQRHENQKEETRARCMGQGKMRFKYA